MEHAKPMRSLPLDRVNGNGHTNGNGLSGAEHAVCHEALFADTMCLVMLVDRAGRILEMNDSAREAIKPEFGPSCTLFDIMPEKVARERLTLMQRSLDEGCVMRVEGMMWGTMRRCTYRPLEHSVLVTSCPMVLHEHQRDGNEIVRAKQDDLGVLAALTEREMEVMALIGEGLSTNDIAKRLHRSEKTVEWHRASLGHKLGVTNRVELARIALRAGLCSLPEGSREGRVEETADRGK